jgi:acetoin utilization protein AcuC
MSTCGTHRFFFHPGALDYDFGPSHPLRPERLKLTLDLMSSLGMFERMPIEKLAPAERDDLLRCHSAAYLEAVERASDGHIVAELEFGLRAADNPSFPGMFEASCAYTGASIAAAQAVLDGASIAYSIAGGLHHANRSKASGFCVFNDCAIACSILRDRFRRVVYVDLDLHHGDGVQWLFYDDPTVLTFSIHQDGHSLFPGTGFPQEIGEGAGTGASINLPMPPGSTDRLWLEAFEPTLRRAFELYQPEAVVLQTGADPHYKDPLGNLRLTAQGWLEAVKLVAGFGLPMVVVGGGGYEMTTVPRMWTAAIAYLTGFPLPDVIPAGQCRGETHFFDRERPEGERDAEEQLDKHVRSMLSTVRTTALGALEKLVTKPIG